MNIRNMTRQDLDTVIEWCRTEQWNPGNSDADAFWEADPEGYFVALEDDRLISSVSVVNHDSDHAYLGFYVCIPEFRGKGYGIAVWNEAIKHAGERSISLDGVEAQISNYAKSGFQSVDSTVRYCGKFAPKRSASSSSNVRVADSEGDLSALIATHKEVFGYERDAFAKVWYANMSDRKTLVLKDNGDKGMLTHATFRAADDGFKVGPLCADNRSQVMALLEGRPIGGEEDALYIDVPGKSPELADLLKSIGFEPIFRMARMTRGTPTKTKMPTFCAYASVELG